MKRSIMEIEAAAKNIFGNAAFVEYNGFKEFKIYTECWGVDAVDMFKFLHETRLSLTAIYVDGGLIMLRAKSCPKSTIGYRYSMKGRVSI